MPKIKLWLDKKIRIFVIIKEQEIVIKQNQTIFAKVPEKQKKYHQKKVKKEQTTPLFFLCVLINIICHLLQ